MVKQHTFYCIKQAREDKFLSSQGFWTDYSFSKEFNSETEARQFIYQLTSISTNRHNLLNIAFTIEKYSKLI